MRKEKEKWIWVFHGEGALLTSAVFTSRKKAESWIKQIKASGMLTRMPLNKCVFDWVVEKGYFEPTREDQQTTEVKQTYTSSRLVHFHYKEGEG
ncbi:MAG: hypothetical protein LUH10_10375 [Tannerellaceae bacterium]|nr:hypothetical protein [Tannerellaceae bacterium]